MQTAIKFILYPSFGVYSDHLAILDQHLFSSFGQLIKLEINQNKVYEVKVELPVNFTGTIRMKTVLLNCTSATQ